MSFHLTPQTENQRWQTVVSRAREEAGTFVYAVVTTGIYCRPGCSARTPRRENVVFFETSTQAEAAGYRPCKRCRPTSPLPRNERLIIQACQHMEKSPDPVTLEDLAVMAGMSPSHFHRLFKKAVGVTPKQYTSALKNRRFLNYLQNGHSITEAIYAAGFGSSSRVYDGDKRLLPGMAPGSYRDGGQRQLILYGFGRCFLGWVLAAATRKGVCAVELGNSRRQLLAQLQANLPHAAYVEGGPQFSLLLRQIIASIETPHSASPLPLDIQGTTFQCQVWNSLRRIPPGTTASYSDIARHIGTPKASRAVANACSQNRIAVLVPCHRVLGKDNALCGYRWGTERKRLLIYNEKEEL